MKFVVLIFMGLLLNGCGPKVIASTHKQVIIGNATSYNMDSCQEVAEKECQKYNKHAKFVPVDLGYQVAGYSCVSK